MTPPKNATVRITTVCGVCKSKLSSYFVLRGRCPYCAVEFRDVQPTSNTDYTYKTNETTVYLMP